MLMCGARFGWKEAPRPTPLASADRAALAEQIGYRDHLVAEITARTAQLSHDRTPAVRQRAIAELARLTADRDALSQEIADTLRTTDTLAATARLLQSCPGIGPLTAAVLAAPLPELGTLKAKAIASLAGLAPCDDRSGQRVGKARITGGRPRVRAAWYLAALVAVRHHPVLKAFYGRRIAAGKPPKLALIACARKLLVLLNAMLRTEQPWNPPQLAQNQP